MQLVKFSQIKQAHVKMVIAGPGKAGKTFFSVAHNHKTLFLCTEQSQANLAISAAIQLGKAKADNIHTVSIDSLETLKEALGYAREHVKEYGVIVVDNLTGIEEMIDSSITDDKPNIDTRSYYRELGKRMRAIINAISALENNLVVIVHTKEQMDDTGTQMIRLAMGGNVSKDTLRKSFNLIGYASKLLFKGKVEHWIEFDSPSKYLNFTGGHPNLAEKEPADLTAIFNKIKGD